MRVKLGGSMYVGERDENAKRTWFEQAFLSVLDAIVVDAITWEDLIDRISTSNQGVGTLLDGFYRKCRQFNLAPLAL